MEANQYNGPWKQEGSRVIGATGTTVATANADSEQLRLGVAALISTAPALLGLVRDSVTSPEGMAHFRSMERDLLPLTERMRATLAIVSGETSAALLCSPRP